MTRRALLFGGVAALAAAGGVGWRVLRDAGTTAPAELWALRFARPAGGDLDMATLRGQPLVLNFWATWCAPCIKEMPELDRFQREFGARGWRVVGLAVDRAEPVNEFLTRLPVSFDVGLVGFDGTELARRLGNASGALPFTVIFDRDGRIAQRKLGATDFDALAGWARTLG
jgi:thiol-disulfide isomerase/thioredoxin